MMKKMNFAVWVCMFLVFSVSSLIFAAPPEGSGYSWKLVFEDNFEGDSLDTDKWTPHHPWTRSFKGQAYNRDENITVADGMLTITAKAEEYEGHQFTSGAISTGYNKFRFKYGYAEARMKLPGARGSWSNFWMLDDGWPPELDVFEYPLNNISGDNNHHYRFYTNYHYDGGSSPQWIWRNINFSNSFNTFAVNWQPGYMAWHLNDSVVRQSWNNYFNDPGSFYMIFDYFVGGQFGDEVWSHPNPATWPDPSHDSVQMKIDWVRVWQRKRSTDLDCIGHWRLDETAGTAAADSSGKQMHGTLRGNMSFDDNSVEGVLGGALEFDGQGAYIELPSGFNEFDNGFSATFWAYPTEVKTWARFIELGRGPGDNNIVIARHGDSNDLTVRAYGGSSAGNHVRAVNAIELNKWQFFAVTIDTNGHVRIYKDGQVIQTGSTTWPWGVWRTRNYIGRSNWDGDDFYQGYMDDIRIFDYALIPNEVHDIYHADIPQPYGDRPAAVPGRVQAEHFDRGGQGVGYYDKSSGNSGGEYRPDEDVDIRAINDFGSGYAVTDIEPGEWLRYTLSVTDDADYCVYLRAATDQQQVPVIIKRTEVPIVELPTFEAVGVYDEQQVQTNSVNHNMGYSPNTTWTTGIGQELGENQILTLEEFKPMVEDAFLQGNGGVINFDDIELPASFSFDASFAGGAKRFTISSLSGTIQTSGPMENRTAISGQQFLTTDGTPHYYFDFENFTGMDSNQIVAVGVTLLGRSGSMSTSNWRVAANYTNGTDVGSSSTFRTINTGSGNGSDDSFAGIMAPEGYWITGIRIHCDQNAYTGIDDLAFVFADSPSAQAPVIAGQALQGQADGPNDDIIVGQITVTNTGSGEQFHTFVLNDIELPTGNNQRLTLEFPEGGLDLNWFQISKQGPYEDLPHDIPGRIQAQEYDMGGPGFAYHDTTRGNTSGSFRPYEDVDVAQIRDGQTNYAVDNIETGEWLTYTVNSSETETDVHIRVASEQDGAQVIFRLDGELLASVDVPNTGSLTNWETVSASCQPLPERENGKLTVEFAGSGFRLNWFQFANQVPYLGVPFEIPGRIDFVNFDIGGQGLSYFDTTLNYGSSLYRPEEAVDILSINDAGTGYGVYALSSEWLEYTSDIMPGMYTIKVRHTSNHADQELTMSAGRQVLATLTLPGTGGWANWQETVFEDVLLPAGEQTLRFTLNESTVLLNSVEFTRKFNPADITQSGRVDMSDFSTMAEQWLGSPGTPSADIAPPQGDGIVDLYDLQVLVENWLATE